MLLFDDGWLDLFDVDTSRTSVRGYLLGARWVCGSIWYDRIGLFDTFISGWLDCMDLLVAGWIFSMPT